MAYRNDKDLQFLSELDSKDLDILVEIITRDPKDGKLWKSEHLTGNEKFKEYYPEHSVYWEEIAEEIQYWGANSIVSFVRREGVLYQEIVKDVADKIGVILKGISSIEEKENAILLKLFSDSLKEMGDKDRMKLIQEMNLVSVQDFSSEAIIVACQLLFKAGGIKSFQLTAIISNAIVSAIMRKTVVFAGNAVIARGAAVLTGPIGLGITALWTIFDLAGPAYRVTIPAVAQIAFLRKNYLHNRDELIKRIEEQLL